MKLTLGMAEQAYLACQRIKDEKLNIKVAYQLIRLINELETEMKNIEQFRRGIIEKYCERDEDGNPVTTKTAQGEGISIKEEFREEAQKELTELFTTEIDIKDYKFTADDFNNINISISELYGLFPFLQDEKGEN